MSDFQDQTSNVAPSGDNPDDFPDEAGYSSGENTEVTTVAVQDPVLAQYQQEKFRDKWLEELEAAEKERKDFVNDGYMILTRWGNKTDKKYNGLVRARSRLPLFWRNTELKRGATYGQTPQPDIKRRWSDPNDQVSRVASIILSRVIEYELDIQDFDSTMNTILNDRLVPGIGVAWLRLEQVGGQQVTGPYYGQQIPRTDAVGQPVLDSDGQPMMVPHPLAEQMVRSPVTAQLAHVDHVPWDDFLWSPCRTWNMCRWQGRRIPMSKQAVTDRFGTCCPEDTLAMISYDNTSENKDKTDKDKVRTKNQVESTTDVYEIWDKELKLIWWINKSANLPLDVQKDTNEFPDFFPSPTEPLATVDGSSTIPYADYKFTQDLYEDIDEAHNRFVSAIQAAIVRFAYNAANAELKDLLTTTGEFQGIPVKDFANWTERGGLNHNIEFVDISALATAAMNLAKAKQQLISDLDDVEGLAELMSSAPATNETQLATQTKTAFGTTRLSIFQRAVSKYIQHILRKKAHLICRFYDPTIIMQRVGTLTPADQKLVPQALQLLKNEEMRGFKLSISTDSLMAPNQNLEKQDRIQAFTALSQALETLLPAVQKTPQLAPLVFEGIKWLISGFKEAQYMEGEIDTLLAQLQQAAQSGQKPPTPPSPEELKLQAVTVKAQSDEKIAAMTEETKRHDNALDASIDMQRLGLDKDQQQIDAQTDALKAHDDMKNSVHDHTMDRIDAQHRAKDTIHSHAIDILGAQPPKPDVTLVVGAPK